MKKMMAGMLIGLAALAGFAAADAAAPLKVLMIGNSFSQSCLVETPAVARAMGCRLDLANLYIGGCSLRTHWDNVVAGTVLGEGFRPYSYNRWTEGVHAVSNAAANIVWALDSDRWDVVTLQQASHSSWDAASYDYAITYLVDLVRQHAPQAKIMLQETWSYPPWDGRLKAFGFDGPEMYRRLHAAYAKFARRFGVAVIPVGTAAENVPDRARLFTEPDFHFNREGQYLQGLVWTASLFGVDVSDCPYLPEGVDAARGAVLRAAAREACAQAAAEGAGAFVARLSSVAVAAGALPAQGFSAEARDELERHLALVAGRPFVPAAGAADLTIVLGERAPGAGEPEPFTAYAKLAGDRLYLWGDDARCPGTLFAVYGFLEKVLGVVWPVPGDANIVAPPSAVARLPRDWSWRYCPPLRCGMIRGGKPLAGAPKDGNAHLAPNALRRTAEQIVQANDDFRRWKLRQKMFVREDMPFGHAFTGWNDKYFDTHPEYLALQANGVRGLAKKGSRDAQYMKLCLANEDVVDLIVTNYVKAGCPKYYNICPNDGYRFCRCEKCRALDCPVTEDEREMNISKAVNLTDRYVNFWNRIAAKVVAIRPDVMLNTYAYSCYRDPPRRERVAFPDNMCFGMVPSQEDDNLAQIRAWKERGLKHFKLRPNYLCYKGWIPRGYERFFLENFRMNFREGMIGTDYDASSLRSGVTAFEYYAIARAHQDPEVAFEQVEREFLSQYGAAAPKMKEYYGRVRERGERALYAKQRVRAGGGDKEAVLDDSLLVGTVLGANPPEELEKDEEVLRAALATPGLSAAEYRRVRAVSVLPRHALLARDFQLAFDSEKTGEMAPDFVEKGLRLMDYRIKEVQPAVGPVNWGPSFRAYPFEVKYWRQAPIRKELRKLYPEMGYEG